MTKIGFTGTQQTTTIAQLSALHNLLDSYKPEEFHHGCCKGADTEAHMVAYMLHIPIVYHPPSITTKMSDFRDFPGTWRAPKAYLIRNHEIVDETDFLIAVPRSNKEEVRSGTWATVRYARKMKKRVILIYPDGYVTGYAES